MVVPNLSIYSSSSPSSDKRRFCGSRGFEVLVFCLGSQYTRMIRIIYKILEYIMEMKKNKTPQFKNWLNVISN